jgi:hypothetical protein
LIELDGFSEWQGLDTAILPGKAERFFGPCNCPGLMEDAEKGLIAIPARKPWAKAP